ncbi:response regulator transcription factor [Eubacteriales bacterium OttesenSCG-928-A19]|nr:response regulator transcription factor [Eubacteriales bacterium OttesenSCG-928-A19]
MKMLIVDDDPLIVKSLSLTLSREDDIEVIGCAKDGAEALRLLEEETPDIVLMDIRMPGVDGIAATRLIKQRYPHVRVMMLTTFDDKPNIQQALAAGAGGYLIKTDKMSDIAGKLRTMMDGAGVLSTGALQKLTMHENPAMKQLTQRELDITRLVAQGLTNREIAAQLFLSEGTVRNNIVVIMEKLCVNNRTQLGMAYYAGKET